MPPPLFFAAAVTTESLTSTDTWRLLGRGRILGDGPNNSPGPYSSESQAPPGGRGWTTGGMT